MPPQESGDRSAGEVLLGTLPVLLGAAGGAGLGMLLDWLRGKQTYTLPVALGILGGLGAGIVTPLSPVRLLAESVVRRLRDVLKPTHRPPDVGELVSSLGAAVAETPGAVRDVIHAGIEAGTTGASPYSLAAGVGAGLYGLHRGRSLSVSAAGQIASLQKLLESPGLSPAVREGVEAQIQRLGRKMGPASWIRGLGRFALWGVPAYLLAALAQSAVYPSRTMTPSQREAYA